ncbi:uncharacterized protein [Misgurnus anguillicaudatus]|uniref:uncharacterized protein isoform X2 n=1 Tax=Misgurnus anguillicaudatus TaxID=75329 RepID=UPI003CCF7FF1
MVSGQSAILVWKKDIVNHFWFCCQMANNREEFMGMWRGVLHHVCGVHEWALGKCQHQPLDAVSSSKDCMLSRSAAHEALSQIVLNRRWLKDVEKFLKFRSTSELEAFQNHLLMYVSKRFAFSPPVYEARTLLAALDYNHHNHRPVHINQRGEVSQRRLYSKKSKRYRVHTVKVSKEYNYIPQLQRQILGTRLKSSGGLPRRRSLRPDDPRTLGLLTGVVPPSTAELAHKSAEDRA